MSLERELTRPGVRDCLDSMRKIVAGEQHVRISATIVLTSQSYCTLLRPSFDADVLTINESRILLDRKIKPKKVCVTNDMRHFRVHG